MPHGNRARERGSLFVILGGLGMVASGLLLLKRVEPFYTWFFPWMWWSYIIFISGIIMFLDGQALLILDPDNFLLLVLVSASFWFLIELFNVRLSNWKYMAVPKSLGWRWMGYVLAFGTVLPAILETAKVIELTKRLIQGTTRFFGPPYVWGDLRMTAFLDPAPRFRGDKLRGDEIWISVGFMGLFLPLIWPRIFFPLVWGGFFFLFDALNARYGWSSVLREWSSRQFGRTIALLLSGCLCGILWELWNYWAGAKWVYSLPVLSHPKIFEMPVAGYLGFPVFALECFAVASFCQGLHSKLTPLKKALFWLVLFFVSVTGCWSIDHFTVISFSDA